MTSPDVLRLVRTRPMTCPVCRVTVEMRSATDPDPECPEFLQLPEPGSGWIAPIEEPHGGMVRMVFVCSDACLRTMLQAGMYL